MKKVTIGIPIIKVESRGCIYKKDGKLVSVNGGGYVLRPVC